MSIMTFLLFVLFLGFVSADNNLLYKDFEYGQRRDIKVRGDLTAAGVKDVPSERNSWAYRHDVRFYNVITKQYTPSSGYFQAQGFQLIESEPGDNFSGRRGLFYAPLEASVVEKIATYANGEPSFVKARAENYLNEANTKFKDLLVDSRLTYLDFGTFVYYSGGGGFTQKQVGNGTTSPLYQTTFNITPFPAIKTFEAKGNLLINGYFDLNTETYAVYDGGNISKITITGGPDQINKEINVNDFIKSNKIGSYTHSKKGQIKYSQLSSILNKPGTYKAKLVVTDPFARKAEKEISFTILPNDTSKPDLYVSKVTTGTFRVGNTINTQVTVGSAKESPETKTAKVKLSINSSKELGEKTVTLKPEEEKVLTFIWKADQKTSGYLTATINIPPEFEEVTLTNNTKEVWITIDDPVPQIVACSIDETANQGELKRERKWYTYDCSYYDWDREEWVYRDCQDFYDEIYNEHLNAKIVNIAPSTVKAGMGFGFEVETEYYVDIYETLNGTTRMWTDRNTISYLGTPSKVEVEFPEPYHPETGKYLHFNNDIVPPPKAEMELVSTEWRGDKFITKWALKQTWVEEYSGNIFYDPLDWQRDPGDELLDGGRKWYTPFYQPDGDYPFKINVYGVGGSGLRYCDNQKVNIFGSPIEDFVIRRVNPSDPFPAGVGKNWVGNEYEIEKWSDWYWDDTDPNTIDTSNLDGVITYYFTIDKIKEIKSQLRDENGFTELMTEVDLSWPLYERLGIPIQQPKYFWMSDYKRKKMEEREEKERQKNGGWY